MLVVLNNLTVEEEGQGLTMEDGHQVKGEKPRAVSKSPLQGDFLPEFCTINWLEAAGSKAGKGRFSRPANS